MLGGETSLTKRRQHLATKLKKDLDTVFVLGAGFTKALASAAPLLTDDYDISKIESTFKDDSFISKIIAKNRVGKDKIALENLLGRAMEFMPYDSRRKPQLDTLAKDVTSVFVEKIGASCKVTSPDALERFASWCVFGRHSCLTFNYDLVLDEALHNVQLCNIVPERNFAHWHPDSGYGFFLRPSSHCISIQLTAATRCFMELLKLHGSLNWYPLKASPKPYRPESIVHDSIWSGLNSRTTGVGAGDVFAEELISRHVESQPFIVPPLNSKAQFYLHPLLSIIWEAAFETLRKAKQVVFIGFSLPESDRSASFLFSEAIPESVPVIVVGKTECAKLRSRYQAVLPGRKLSFRWGGAAEWIMDNLPAPYKTDPNEVHKRLLEKKAKKSSRK